MTQNRCRGWHRYGESPEESATAVRPVPRLLVSVGVKLLDVPPLPNWPLYPDPQHDTAPLSRMAQVWEFPEESATAVRLDQGCW